MLIVKTTGAGLELKAPFADKERIKLIEGRRWDAERKNWVVPKNPITAARILDIFKLGEIQGDEAFYQLARRGADGEVVESVDLKGELEQPAIRHFDLWRHQLEAYHFAYGKQAAMLAMAMGTGKSKVTVDLIFNRGHKRVLICCPKTVLSVWPKEFAKHAGEREYAIYNSTKGSIEKRAKDIQEFLKKTEKEGVVAVVVLNYEAAWRPPLGTVYRESGANKTKVDDGLLKKAGFDLVVLDESHRIKSASGRASRFFSQLGDYVPHRLALTGTPMPHSPLDIYAQYRFLDKSIFGTSNVIFKSRYAIMGGYGGKAVVGYQNEDEFRRRFEGIAYQVKADVLDLPEAVHIERFIELSKTTRACYDEMYHKFVVQVKGGEIIASNALARLLRLAQITSGYLPIDDEGRTERIGTEKMDDLKDIFEDLQQAEPVVVFARFRHDLDQIREVTESTGRRYAELSGRQNDLATWQEGWADVICVQIQAGGVGIDLTRARYCIYYSVGYSLGDYEQSLARVHRPGQTRSVIYYHLIAKNSVDESVYAALSKRKQVIEEILTAAVGG